MRLQGKVAIITGAASGIGQAAAILFAKEEAKVVVVDRNVQEGQECVQTILRKGGEATFIQADISITVDVQNMIKTTISKYGKLHILYNNAAIFLPGIDGPVTEIDEGTWDRIHNVNLRGVFLCCKHGIPEIIKSGGGSVINVSSGDALIGVGYDAYTASKGGIISLTRSMAVEYAPHKVRVNCIIPGTIKTPINLEERKDPALAKKYAQMSSLKRLGEPEEVAYMALFLASDESSYAVGGTFVVDGGMTVA